MSIIEKEPKWANSLLFQSYTLNVQHADGCFVEISDEPLGDFPQPMKIIIKINSSGFSQFKTRELGTMKHIGPSVSSLSAVVRIESDDLIGKDFFPLPEYETPLNEIAAYVTKDTIIRIECFNKIFSSEYTMREFISPVLIGSIRLAKKKLLNEKIPVERLELTCEKNIIGLHAHGPVDYTIMFDCLDIVLTEAKKHEVEDGILQNLLQQRASQEFLSNTLLSDNASNEHFVGYDRKRKFNEIFKDIASIPTFGIVSTGSEWVLTKLLYNSVTEKSSLQISHKITVSLAATEVVIFEEMKKLILKLANLILQHVENVRGSEKFQFQRNSSCLASANIALLEVHAALAVDTETRTAAK
jgi:hypothetical protein